MRFGRLVALEPTDKRVGDMVVWRCVCDCGNVTEAASSNLTRGRVRSCGCLASETHVRDRTGERHGKLVVVRKQGTGQHGEALWLCKCDCGNEAVMSSRDFYRGKKDCGCESRSRYDLTGQRFGKLVAVRPVGKRGRYVLWECRCDCGNTKNTTSQLLKIGRVKSCGCAPKGRPRKSDVERDGAGDQK